MNYKARMQNMFPLAICEETFVDFRIVEEAKAGKQPYFIDKVTGNAIILGFGINEEEAWKNSYNNVFVDKKFNDKMEGDAN